MLMPQMPVPTPSANDNKEMPISLCIYSEPSSGLVDVGFLICGVMK